MSKRHGFVATILLFVLCLGISFTAMQFVAADDGYFDYSSMPALRDDVDIEDIVSAFEAEYERVKDTLGLDESGVNVQQPGVNNHPMNGTVVAQLTGTKSNVTEWDAAGYAQIIYNPHTKTAYSVYDDFMSQFAGGGAGYPLSQVFFSQDGNTAYQNFSGGYLSGDYSAASGITNSEWNGLKTMNQTTLTDRDITSNEQAIMFLKYGDALISVYANDKPYDFYTFTNAFADVAEEWDIQRGDFVYGLRYNDWPSLGENFWTVVKNLGTGNLLHWSVTDGAFLILNTDLEEVFVVKDAFAESMYMGGLSSAGVPVSNDFDFDGKTYQNFHNGYYELNNGNLVYYEAQNISAEGVVSSICSIEDVGKLPSSLVLTQAQEDAGYTLEGITDAITTALADLISDEEYGFGIPTGLVSYSEELSAFYQMFYNPENQQSTYVFTGIDGEEVVANVVFGDIANAYRAPEGYSGNYPGIKLLGAALDEQFTIGSSDTIYQNFTFGHIVLSGSTAKFIVGKLIADNAGVAKYTMLDFSDAIFAQDGLDDKLPASFDISADELVELFKAKYAELLDSGFAVGIPDNEGIRTWVEDSSWEEGKDFPFGRGVVCMNFRSGDSEAKPWYDANLYMFYNSEDGKVYTVTGGIMSYFAYFRGQLGAPLGEMFTVSGMYYQNFQLGYVRATQLGNGSYIDDMFYDKDLNMVVPTADREKSVFVKSLDKQFKPDDNGYTAKTDFVIENLREYFIIREGVSVTFTTSKGTVSGNKLTFNPTAVGDETITITATAADGSTATMTFVIKVIKKSGCGSSANANAIVAFAAVVTLLGVALIKSKKKIKD